MRAAAPKMKVPTRLAGRIERQVLIVHRVGVEAAARLCPAGAFPAVSGASALLLTTWAHLARVPKRWLPSPLASGVEHLSMRLLVERAAEGATQDHATRERLGAVFLRATSSRLSAGLAAALTRARYTHADFDVRSSATEFSILARDAAGELLAFSAECAGTSRGSLFANGSALAELLGPVTVSEPPDLFAPHLDALRLGNDRAAEPLCVRRAELRLPAELGEATLDSAWELVTARRRPLVLRAPETGRALEGPSPLPAC